MMGEKKYYSVQQAAKIADVQPHTVYAWIRYGRGPWSNRQFLRSRLIDDVIFVEKTELDVFIANRLRSLKPRTRQRRTISTSS
jgi:hypothetical protein